MLGIIKLKEIKEFLIPSIDVNRMIIIIKLKEIKEFLIYYNNHSVYVNAWYYKKSLLIVQFYASPEAGYFDACRCFWAPFGVAFEGEPFLADFC